MTYANNPWGRYLRSLVEPAAAPPAARWTDAWVGPDEHPNSAGKSLAELLAAARARKSAARAARAVVAAARRTPDFTPCGAVVRGLRLGAVRQCSREAVRGGFCLQHHKALVTSRGPTPVCSATA